MMLRRAALPLAILTGFGFFAIPAQAAPVQVSIMNTAFNPKVVTVTAGGTVTWTNNDSFDHTSTDVGFWDSGHIHSGASYSQTVAFRNAGSYAYICTIHNMHGTVQVRMAKSGSSSNGFTVRWSTAAHTPVDRNFDVQIKRPGSAQFTPFRTMTTALQVANFHPARAGTYRFEARTRIVSSGKTSGWSPALTLSIS
jgi:plastocyanin